MVLYTECVAAEDALPDGEVRIRRCRYGAGVRDGTPASHPPYMLYRADIGRVPVPGTVERQRMEPTDGICRLKYCP
jgi:hypothetical protein